MANYFASSRTNAVKIIDKDGLIEALAPFNIDIVWVDAPEPMALFLVSEGSDSGSMYDWALDEDDNDLEFSFEDFILPYVAPGEVLIYQEIGSEKLRYLNGFSEAYVKDEAGEVKQVSLSINDIYEKAAQELGVHRDEIALNTYNSLPNYIEIAKEGDINKLKNIILDGFDLQRKLITIASYAAGYGQVQLLEYLVKKHDLDPSSPDILKHKDKHPALKAWVESMNLSEAIKQDEAPALIKKNRPV